jgi:crotonobetainyl-CoA:carnitine CoA-transferase CaiB-like acyl-CoA transferase
MEQALAGFRVLDFGHYIPGPYAAMLLAEQGAEVIKIERPEGDPLRSEEGFRVLNRSKKGMVLDLKQAEGKKIAQALIEKADVLIENFKPGKADELGIGYQSAQALNPGLVYCSISGYGQSGLYRDRSGWDPIVSSTATVYIEQGGAGIAPPVFLVLPLASYYSAFMAAYSITIALIAREKTGRGRQVDISLLNSIMAAECGGLVQFEARERVPRAYQQGGSPVYRLYQGSDGKWFFLALGNLAFLTKFAMAMGHEEWLIDERFEGAPFMILPPVNEELIAMFEKIFAEKSRDEWLEFLRAEDIPCGPALPVETFLDDPQVSANNMVITLEEPGLGPVRQMGVPVRLSLVPGGVKGPSPQKGEHTEEILAGWLNYSVDEISRLKKKKVIC